MRARARLPGFTNLPGAEKSTLARTLEHALIGRSSRASIIVGLLAGAGLQLNQIPPTGNPLVC
jgi:adenylylsulfate kinase-like enzyme